jgi:phosphate starvation-inducible membrane PsiE
MPKSIRGSLYTTLRLIVALISGAFTFIYILLFDYGPSYPFVLIGGVNILFVIFALIMLLLGKFDKEYHINEDEIINKD